MFLPFSLMTQSGSPRNLVLTITAVLGLASCVSVQVLTFFIAGVYSDSSGMERYSVLALQVFFFFSCLLMTYILSTYTDKALEHRKVIIFVCALSMVVGSLLFIGNMLYKILIVYAFAWSLLGLGFGGVYALFFAYFTLNISPSTELLLAFSIFIGTTGATLLTVFSFTEKSLFAATMILAALSAFSAIVCLFTLSKEQSNFMRGARQFSVFMTSNAAASVSRGFIFGFAIVSVISIGEQAIIAATLALSLGSAIGLAFSFMPNKHYSNATTQRRILLVMALALIVTPLLSYPESLTGYCLVFAILGFTRTRNAGKGVVTNSRYRLNPLTHFPSLFTPELVGIILAILFSMLVIQGLSLGGIPLFMVLVVTAGILFVAVIVHARITDGKRPSVLLPEQTDTAESDDCGSDISSRSKSANRKRFRDRCDEIIIENGLTKREAEIFSLLAKGRNAAYISDMFFISIATARTHIYHIYSKLNITSHQELIDLIDIQKGTVE
jgi:DNA-binding CsgD family transcriptional regulator